jgi:hypothetical protein
MKVIRLIEMLVGSVHLENVMLIPFVAFDELKMEHGNVKYIGNSVLYGFGT